MMRAPRSSVPLAVLSVIALALLFGRAAGTGNDEPAAVVEPAVRDAATVRDAASAPAARGDAAHVAVLARPRRAADEPVVDLFSGRSWAPPPPSAPAAAPPPPPPAPTAPALPYAYLGRVEAPDEKTVVYLARGDRMVTATEGEVIDQIYRVESLGESEIVLTFMPLGQKQILRIEGGPK